LRNIVFDFDLSNRMGNYETTCAGTVMSFLFKRSYVLNLARFKISRSVLLEKQSCYQTSLKYIKYLYVLAMLIVYNYQGSLFESQ
jgi:hypothetical protein